MKGPCTYVHVRPCFYFEMTRPLAVSLPRHAAARFGAVNCGKYTGKKAEKDWKKSWRQQECGLYAQRELGVSKNYQEYYEHRCVLHAPVVYTSSRLDWLLVRYSSHHTHNVLGSSREHTTHYRIFGRKY